MQIKHIYNEQCGLGEGAYWHYEEQMFYWIDIKFDRIHSYHPQTQEFQMWQLPGLVSAISACKSGGLIIGYEDKIAHFDTVTSDLGILYDTKSGMRMNDGLTDPAGRFWIGQADDSMQNQAKLFRYDPDGSVHVMEENLGISNGLDWDIERSAFYLSDSLAGAIYAYDYDVATGRISNRRQIVHADINDGGVPDGMILDTDGNLWCGMWDGHRITQYSPTGELLQSIDMPVQRPTKCVFGGADLATLYVTSAASNRGSDEQFDCPNGYVFALDVGACGRRLTAYG
jgi:sugar lactone lactonase YvrE